MTMIVGQQLHEMELVRRKIYELEQAQLAIKAKCVFLQPLSPFHTTIARNHRFL